MSENGRKKYQIGKWMAWSVFLIVFGVIPGWIFIGGIDCEPPGKFSSTVYGAPPVQSHISPRARFGEYDIMVAFPRGGNRMSGEKRRIVDYMVVCVNDYADRHGLSRVDSFDYLLRNKGLDSLEDCYEAEHMLSLVAAGI